MGRRTQGVNIAPVLRPSWLRHFPRMSYDPTHCLGTTQCRESNVGIIEWARRRETPLQRRVFSALKSISRLNLRPVPIVHRGLLTLRRFRRGPLRVLASKLYSEPLLRLQCTSVGEDLLVEENMPKILGHLSICLGKRVTLSGEQVWIAAGGGSVRTLQVGDDCSIGYQTELIVGTSIQIGNHVRIASRVSLNGYDGHPLDPLARARDEPPGPERSGPIAVLDYAWIGSGVTILKGVTVGRGAIVASRAVVTRDVPELALVAGNPARVVRNLAPPPGWQSAESGS
jgi:acetyltransferase-like isoleucine patch superfamily enzyme